LQKQANSNNNVKNRNREFFEQLVENMEDSRKKDLELFLKGLSSDFKNVSDTAALPKRTKNIKVDVDVWETLNVLKERDQTFNDVIAKMLGSTTQTKGNKNLLAIKYKRKRAFFTTTFAGQQLGCEFEYNDSKGVKNDFTLDVQIKKVFIGKKTMSASEFFGVDNTHKHYSKDYLILYLKSITVALRKEFRISFKENALRNDYENLVLWRKLYYEHGLSEDSFTSDVEDPLRLSEEEPVTDEWKRSIQSSLANKMSSEWNRLTYEQQLMMQFNIQRRE
jgi:predicted CopG family antitoxin